MARIWRDIRLGSISVLGVLSALSPRRGGSAGASAAPCQQHRPTRRGVRRGSQFGHERPDATQQPSSMSQGGRAEGGRSYMYVRRHGGPAATPRRASNGRTDRRRGRAGGHTEDEAARRPWLGAGLIGYLLPARWDLTGGRTKPHVEGRVRTVA